MTRDRGLAAVARVRGVREQESRLGLRRALAEQHQRGVELEALRDQLSAAARLEAGLLEDTGPAETSPAEASPAGTPPAELPQEVSRLGQVLTLRMTLDNLGVVIGEARDALTAADRIVDLARDRWESDKTRLTAVERLIEHRAAERRAEVARAGDREQDELAASGWLRARRLAPTQTAPNQTAPTQTAQRGARA